jgi:hypothetical protein
VWNSIAGVIAELKKCEDAGATAAAIAMAFVCIDTMAFLSMPEEQTAQGRQDFIDWVNLYLEGHQDQPYQYAGIDVYAARCALLHAFGAEAELHRNNPDIKMFGYHDGGLHAFDPDISPNLVLLGTASFFDDVVRAVERFMEACQSSPDLRARVEARLPKVHQLVPILHGGRVNGAGDSSS